MPTNEEAAHYFHLYKYLKIRIYGLIKFTGILSFQKKRWLFVFEVLKAISSDPKDQTCQKKRNVRDM